MLRTIFFWLNVLIFTTLGAIGTIIIGFFQRQSRWSYRNILQVWARVLMWAAGAKMRVEGLENIDPNRAYIVVSNHQSLMDIPALVAALPLHLTIVAKKELFKIPIFAQGMRGFGILEIDRSNREKAIETLKQAAQIALDKNISILAFPEGTRTNGKLRPFKKGPFMLALDAHLPILPVSVIGTYDISPQRSMMIHSGKQVVVRVHSPIDIDGYSVATRDELIDKTHDLIASGFLEYER